MGISRVPTTESIADLLCPSALENIRPANTTRLAEPDSLPLPMVAPAAPVIPYCVSPFYAEHIRKSGHYEQLRHIVEPSPDESFSRGEWDTSGEHSNTKMTGLQHKYAQTALMLVTDNCFSYCRFCFRKRFVGRSSDEIAVDYSAIGEYIAAHPEISNLLISGGDPFVLPTDHLGRILDHVLQIPHLRSIRFGTKAIVHHPGRFADPALSELFLRIRRAGKTPAIVSHVDHFAEISPETEALARKFQAIGVQFFNQTVLLNRVNDSTEILTETFRRLLCLGIRPYYLFQARPVCQGSHFQVPFHRAIGIVQGAQRQLGGIEKTFRYIMSHHTGKIEILDLGDDGRVYMRYHQCSNPEKIGRIFSRPYREGACWLDDLPEAITKSA